MSGVPGRPAPSPDAAAMAGWAQLLHDVVERRLRPAAGADAAGAAGPDAGADLLAPSWDTGFDDAFAVVLQQMVRTRLEQLTPEQFVATYRSVRGDAALLADLDRLVDARARTARRELVVLRLVTDATVAGRLRLPELDAGETLELGLFDPTLPHLAAWRFRANAEHRPLHRVLRVRTTAPATGEVVVVADTWTGAVWAERWRTAPVAPMTPARIGAGGGGGGGPVSPELTLHAFVVVTVAGAPATTPPQILGYVRTLDGRLLLDAPGDRPPGGQRPSW